jgi:RND family efflux transporter MFP subunit
MKKKLKKGQLQLALVIAFILGSFIISKLLESTYKPPKKNNTSERILSVEASEISPIDYRMSFKTTGIIEAKNNINIVPEVTGRIIHVHEAFFPGGKFVKNEVLFEIDPRNFELDVQRSTAELIHAKTALYIEQAEADAAISEWEQLNGNREAPPLVARSPQLAESKANLKLAEAQLENSKLNLERTKFTLPFDGRVLNSDIAKGQYVTSGRSYGSVFNQKHLEVKTSLEPHQINLLLNTKDPEVIFHTNYLGKKDFHKGLFKRGFSSLDTGTRFATIRFNFVDSVNDLVPGIFSDIQVYGATVSNVMLLPPSSLQSQGIVWQIQDNQLHKWNPEVIDINNEYIAVKGINKPITIVTSYIPGGNEGMRVNICKSMENKKYSYDK